ncbi:CD3324 family protein [Spirochaeta lutea]|uniref:Mor transcription activator domain-containing protein n=1 Tax=Spirochaeta lutea TaxID=1480694 RepID=A0A098QTV7_9SPIO|nr:CD3324 family protein [Spirochaeta lutea]KGE71021.1 hypothetical protein DC28_13950 [Spirochaeta lutea]
MSYRNAKTILPKDLLQEIQKYIQGEQIYIPRRSGEKLGWGMKNGSRPMIAERNREIRRLKSQGMSLSELADSFSLSTDSIRKIVYPGFSDSCDPPSPE